ncbi:uncharacterized protein [Periplaneta americana]|uniref:uncharacterized protein isoform X4 n=1 Tax=Periplaneta americana TaxID=6978 RepID=UPI0037E80817
MSGKVCAVVGCSNFELVKLSKSFFRFPRDRAVLKPNSVPTQNLPSSSVRSILKSTKRGCPRKRKREKEVEHNGTSPFSGSVQEQPTDCLPAARCPKSKPKGVRRKRDIRPDHIYALRDIGLQRASGARQPYLKRGRHSTSKQSIMPDSCCANGCTNRRVKGGNIQFFTFPFKDQERLKKWIAAVRRRNFLPTRHSRICSEHFRKEDYLVRPNINVPRLNSSAVPSIFHAHPKKATRKTRNRRKKLCDTTSENVFTTPQKKLDFGQIESSIKREISGVSESSQEHRLEENENNYEEDPLSSKDDENKIKYETESSQILDLDLNSGETMETDSITVKCEALEEVGVIIKEENESLDSYPSDDVQMPFPVVKCENVEEYQYADIVDINNIKQEYPYADIVDISNIKQEATEGQDLVLDGLSSYPA